MASAGLPLIVGIGGMGGNTLNGVSAELAQPAVLLGVDTDEAALEHSLDGHKRLLLGRNMLHGQSAGGRPELGKAAIESSLDDLTPFIASASSVVLIAGLGGGTGSGAIPIIAHRTIELRRPLTCIVSMPFDFEGRNRVTVADDVLMALTTLGVTLRVFRNQDLFVLADQNTTFSEAFRMVDTTIREWIAL